MEYYKAYDARYRQIHALGLSWATDNVTPLIADIMARYGIGKKDRLLELGCGEGRDALPLLRTGYDLLATDVSPEAVAWCRESYPEKAQAFQVLDVCAGALERRFDFIYAAAVLHMLTEDAHRNAFFRFIREHLRPGGIGLALSMGDGEREFCSDPAQAFQAAERSHQQSGQRVLIAATTCRVVSRQSLRSEAERNGLRVLEEGLTEIPGEFDEMIYIVVTKEMR